MFDQITTHLFPLLWGCLRGSFLAKGQKATVGARGVCVSNRVGISAINTTMVQRNEMKRQTPLVFSVQIAPNLFLSR
ncbi:MAG: hypothetical protein HC848_04475 [Limnobacter sp.]|nr:hypothetical protein [Limnobacter sp.]